MVPFTPCTCVCLGSNAWSHLHTVGVSIVGSNPWSCTCVCCGVTFTPCTWVCLGSNLWSHLHQHLCLFWGQMHGPIYTLYLRSNPWSHLHPVFVCVVGSKPWFHLYPELVIKSMVQFTPCTCDQIHGPIYTLYLCLLWDLIHGPI